MDRLHTNAGSFARRGFSDPAAAESVTAGWDQDRVDLLDLLAETADPDLALAGLARLAEVIPDLWDRLKRNSVLARQLCFVLAGSLALCTHLRNRPADLVELETPAVRRPAAALRAELLAAVGAGPTQAVPTEVVLTEAVLTEAVSTEVVPAQAVPTEVVPTEVVLTEAVSIEAVPTEVVPAQAVQAHPVPVADSVADAADRLRLAYRAALLRVAARDVGDPEPIRIVDDVAAELSDLADATLEAALAVARATLGADAARCRLAVVALGKAGGQELNYVSDVDVLFVAEPAHDADGRPLATVDRALNLAIRLAAELTRVCGAYTRCGTIWTVDAALRPEGKAGPLVRTLASHEKYYREWAQTWEFQAMLKARPAAGDLALGQAFVDMVSPLVWQAAERDGFVADTQAMRRRVVDHIPSRDAGRELKLGRGGLRDVEFSVQLLQLVHGRADERLRLRATLPALAALIEHGYVGREDGKEFGRAYRFLRTLEHRIQLFHLRRTHVLPTANADLRRLGRSLRYRNPEAELLTAWRTVISRVSRLQERLFYSPLLDAVARISTSELRLTTQAAQDRLAGLGYSDPAAALRHIRALTSGVTRQAEIQRQLLPAMLGWFAVAPEPDPGLLAFRQVSEALGRSSWYLRALRDEGAMAQRLAVILATSRYAVALLRRAPQSVELLASEADLVPRTVDQLRLEMANVAARQADPETAVAAIRAIRRRELFRIAAADLLGLLDLSGVGAALTDLVSATIDSALAVAREAAGGAVAPAVAVIAMGRWGGRELSYASDADAMFVLADATPAVPTASAPTHSVSTHPVSTHPVSTPSVLTPAVPPDTGERTRLGNQAVTTLRRLLAAPGADPPLPVDVDLRPEGKGGALVRTLAAYRTYYSRWSSTWELQALVRADALAGDPVVGAELMAEIERHRWPDGGLRHEQLTEIRRLKARVEAERMPKGADPRTHLKFGPGGLADVEWTVQLLQLQHAYAVPSLRTSGTLPALQAAEAAGLVSAEDAEVLAAAWTLASRLRNAILLVRGRGSDSLPADAAELAAVAQLLGYGPAAASHLLAEWRRISRRARHVVDRLLWGEART